MAIPAPILPTLCASALIGHEPGKGRAALTLADVPSFAAEFLDYRGIVVPVGLLRGLSEPKLKDLAHRADQAACPFLSIVDDDLLPFHGTDIDASAARLERLLIAARALGAASVGVRVPCEGDDPQVARVARSVREVLEGLSHHEVIVLLRPGTPGLGTTDRFTAFVQRIGGFRIGGMVSSANLDPEDRLGSLRRLAPYCGCIRLAPTMKRNQPDKADLASFIKTVQAVGYQNPICIEVPAGPHAVKQLDAVRSVFAAILDEESSSTASVGSGASDEDGE